MKKVALTGVVVFVMVGALWASVTVASPRCGGTGDRSNTILTYLGNILPSEPCRAQFPDGSPALLTPDTNDDAPWYVVPSGVAGITGVLMLLLWIGLGPNGREGVTPSSRRLGRARLRAQVSRRVPVPGAPAPDVHPSTPV